MSDADSEHKLIQGQGAGKYLPFARRKVAALHDRAKAMGVTALVQRWKLEAGMVEIAVRVVGDQRYIHIRRKQCPPFVSGFIDLVTPVVVEIPNPTPPPATIPALNRFFPSIVEAARRGIERDWIQEPLLIDSGRETVRIKGSMFSGEMRKVVQVLQGMNVVFTYADTGAPTYQPLVSPTHGVFAVKNGQRWVVKISNAGVVAWSMQMCRQPIVDRNQKTLLDYTPIHTPEPRDQALDDAISAGSYRVLLSAEGVLDFYVKSPFFSTCGWAFNSAGHEAANVCREYINGIQEAYLYKISISEDDAGSPTTATLTKVEQGHMDVDRDRCHMKYPRGLGTNILDPFDPGNGNAPIFVETNAPVYCFYDGDELQVFRLIFNRGGTTNSQSELTPCLSGCPSSYDTGPNDSGSPYLVSGSTTTSETPRFDSPAGNLSIQTETQYAATYNSHAVSTTPGGLVWQGGFCDTLVSYVEFYDFQASSYSLSGTEFAQNLLVVPAWDREAVYIAGRLDGRQVTRTSYSAYSFNKGMTTVTGTGPGCGGSFGAGQKVAQCSEICNTNPSNPVQASLTGELVNPSRREFCDNGTRVNLWVGPTVDSTDFSAYNDPLTVGVQDGVNCVLPGGVPQSGHPNFIFTDPNPAPFGNLAANLGYYASGGVTRTFALEGLDIGLPSIFDFDLSAIMVSIRDAFDPGKYIISDDTSSVRGDQCLSTATEYPANEANAGMAFVGVP